MQDMAYRNGKPEDFFRMPLLRDDMHVQPPSFLGPSWDMKTNAKQNVAPCGTPFQNEMDSFTVSLHIINDRLLSAVRVVQGVFLSSDLWESVDIPTGHVNPLRIADYL